MATELEQQISDPSYTQLWFEERLFFLVNAQWNTRQKNKLNSLIRNARFPTSNTAIEEIKYYEDQHLNKAQLLRFATCTYIYEG